MSKNNTVGTKTNFAELPDVDIANKLTAPEFNQISDFQKSPVQKETIFVDTSIVIDGTKEYSTTKVISGATHTITASTSGHVQGNELSARYQFDVDCTITLTNFESGGNNTGKIDPITAGTYDFRFKANARGVNLIIAQNTNKLIPEANTWYVNTNGDDANVGSPEFPFKTIQAAHDAAAEFDSIIIQEFYYFDSNDVTVTKQLAFIGPTSTGEGIAFPYFSGDWTITATTIFQNIAFRGNISGGTFNMDITNCSFEPLTMTNRTVDIYLTDSYFKVNSGVGLKSLFANSSRIIRSNTLNIGRKVVLNATSVEGSINAGIDSPGFDSLLKNSSIEGDFTTTSDLTKINSVIVGNENVTGATTEENQPDTSPEPNTWYVNTNGDDENVGNANFPFETMQKAVDSAAQYDIIKVQDIYYSSGGVIVDKILSIVGPIPTGGGTAFPAMNGTWTIDNYLMFENIAFTADIISSATFKYLEFTNSQVSVNSTTQRNLGIICAGGLFVANTNAEWKWAILNHLEISPYNATDTVTVGQYVHLNDVYHFQEADINFVFGADSTSRMLLYNSTLRGDASGTGDLTKYNSVITGNENVSGTTTDNVQNDTTKLSKTLVAKQDVASDVEFAGNVLADKLAAGVAAQLNALDAREAAIGSGYAGIVTAPADGAIIQGSLGVGIESGLLGPLHIKGNSTLNAVMESSSDSDVQFQLRAGAAPKFLFGYTSSLQGFRVYNFGVADSSLFIEYSTGNIGAGETSPAARVDSNQNNPSAAVPPLKLTQADLSEEMIKFDAAIAIGNPIEAKGAKTFTETHFIKINIEGVGVRYIPAGTIA